MLNKIRSTSYDVEWASARLTTISLISSPTFPRPTAMGLEPLSRSHAAAGFWNCVDF